MHSGPNQAGYFDLRALAAYSCCSVRWLRDRLADRTYPLSCYRVEGKLLVKRIEFDEWMASFRTQNDSCSLGKIVEEVVSSVARRKTA